MIDQNSTFYQFLDGEAARSRERQAALNAEERKDEAVLEKIRENVFDIFRTVLLSSAKRTHSEEEQRAFFQANLNNIPRGWKIAYAQAQAHNDAVRLAQEQVKLDALAQIEAAWQAV